MILEDFFGVSREEMETLKAKEEKIMPSTNRIHYLEQKLKYFKNSGWKLIIYLVQNNPSILADHLKTYSGFEGNEAEEILKDLKKYYAFMGLLSKYKKIERGKR